MTNKTGEQFLALDFEFWISVHGISKPSAHHTHLDPLPSRERKAGPGRKKIQLVDSVNKEWRDLYAAL
ncbi:hypothetical protein ACFLXM_00290 [Chloroflexota bacterium]